MQYYKELEEEMERCGIGLDSERFLRLLQVLKAAKYDHRAVVKILADIDKMKQEREEIKGQMQQLDQERLDFEIKLQEVKDTLPMATQLSQLGIDFGEFLAFHIIITEFCDTEPGMTSKEASWKLASEMKMYNQVGGMQKYISILREQLNMMEMIVAQNKSAIETLTSLQMVGIGVPEITGLNKILDLGKLGQQWQLGWPRQQQKQQPPMGNSGMGNNNGGTGTKPKK